MSAHLFSNARAHEEKGQIDAWFLEPVTEDLYLRKMSERKKRIDIFLSVEIFPTVGWKIEI